MMQGLVRDALELKSAQEMISAYAVLGGTPRYWELARPYGPDIEGALDSLVLDPLGSLHQEPDRLLLEETPSAASLRPLLDIIESGANRMSEIARRLGQRATSLARPLSCGCGFG